jgi:hypothetical protein
MNELQFSSRECDEHAIEACYLWLKAWNSKKPLPMESNHLDIAYAMKHAFALTEN